MSKFTVNPNSLYDDLQHFFSVVERWAASVTHYGLSAIHWEICPSTEQKKTINSELFKKNPRTKQQNWQTIHSQKII